MNLTDCDNIKGLSWYPWIGEKYFSLAATQRILLIGESHYFTNIEQKESYKTDKYSTIECIEESAIDGDWENSTYRYLNYILKRNSKKSNDDIWNMYAYYNFVQNAVAKNERPSFEAFYSGWPVFIELVKILKPSICVFIGVAALGLFEAFMEEAHITHEKIQKPCKISRTWARKASISINGINTKIIGIQHTSQYFAYEEWSEYIDHETEGLIKYYGE